MQNIKQNDSQNPIKPQPFKPAPPPQFKNFQPETFQGQPQGFTNRLPNNLNPASVVPQFQIQQNLIVKQQEVPLGNQQQEENQGIKLKFQPQVHNFQINQNALQQNFANQQIKQQLEKPVIFKPIQQQALEKKNNESFPIQNQSILCSYVGHEIKQVLGVCLNKKCDKNRLYCQICMKQFHDQHIKDLMDFAEYDDWRSSALNAFEKTKNLFLMMEIQIKQIQDFIFNMLPQSKKPISELTTSDINKQTIQLLQIDDLNQVISKTFGKPEEFLENINQIGQEQKGYCSLIQLHELNDKQNNKIQLKINNPIQNQVKFQQNFEVDFQKQGSYKDAVQSAPKQSIYYDYFRLIVLNQFNKSCSLQENNLEQLKLEQNNKQLKLEEAQKIIAKLENDLESLQQNQSLRQFEAESEKTKLQQQISEQQNQIQEDNKKILELQNQFQEAKKKLDQRKQQIFQLKYINQILQQNQTSRNQSFSNEKQFRQQQENQNIRGLTNSQIQTFDQLFQEAQIALEKEAEKQSIVRRKSGALQEKGGKIQCLFVTDFPKNGERYQLSLISSIKCCCQLIKTKTGRDSFWGAITYAGNNGNAIQPFTIIPETVESFFRKEQKVNKVKFVDKPEDLKGALQQAVSMTWDEKFKMVIILSTSACHGNIYQLPQKLKSWLIFERKYDTKPDDNIEGTIVNLIQQNIVLLGIRYTEETDVMYNEIQKIYRKYDRSDLFFTLKIENMNNNQEIIKNINNTVEHIIGTKNFTTKTRVNKIQRQNFFEEAIQDMKSIKNKIFGYFKQNNQESEIKQAQEEQILFEKQTKSFYDCRDGALEALHKQGDIVMFESKVKTVKFQCNVYKIDFKYQILQQKKENIFEINPEDFAYGKDTNVWNCTRTENHFAVGMMKKVNIIKNIGTSELYAGKVPIQAGPYKSLKEAIQDSLMQEFIEKIQQSQNDQDLPKISYTDFVILEEIKEGQPNYWFAEKFMNGEFKKYNNNDGFILEEDSILNRLAQSFSYYTYYESKGNYIVNDVQGFANYFTDPAINTMKGNFDETDNGEEGITNFLIALRQRRNLCAELLDSIGIEMV